MVELSCEVELVLGRTEAFLGTWKFQQPSTTTGPQTNNEPLADTLIQGSLSSEKTRIKLNQKAKQHFDTSMYGDLFFLFVCSFIYRKMSAICA